MQIIICGLFNYIDKINPQFGTLVHITYSYKNKRSIRASRTPTHDVLNRTIRNLSILKVR